MLNSQSATEVTSGSYELEADSWSAFDDFINGNQFFVMEKEVFGKKLFDEKPAKIEIISCKSCGAEHRIMKRHDVKVDRILHPTAKAVEMGWKWGPIAVEMKRSSSAIGPVFAQIFEQQKSLFKSVVLGCTRIMPLIFSVFPCGVYGHDVHSIQETQIILSCSFSKYKKALQFKTLSNNVLEIEKDTIKVNKNWSPSTKRGHRGVVK